MPRIITVLFVVLLSIAASAASPKKVLLFFMNPAGGPCQRQLAILDGISDTLAPLARIAYIKTTIDEDLPKFRQYGIRGLPSLIITDTTGKEEYRFPPGIQPSETVLKKLKNIK